MNEIEFSKMLIEKYNDSFDSMLNIITASVEEFNIEMENIASYLSPKVVNILEEESIKLKLINSDDNVEVFDLG